MAINKETSYREDRRYDRQYCYPYTADGENRDVHEYLTLIPEKEEKLKEFILANVVKTKDVKREYAHSDGYLKHKFQGLLDFYISASDLKKAMTECGFDHLVGANGITWYFDCAVCNVKA